MAVKKAKIFKKPRLGTFNKGRTPLKLAKFFTKARRRRGR